jgi:omega-6 fatty acid desaturase (delta-12 desaturase)
MIKRYQRPDTKKALIQVLNSFLPFLGFWVLMYFSLNWSYWLTFGLAIIAAWFLVRIFIIQHDCGHQSFLKSRKLNNVIGFISSLFSTIPYK